ncbi:MAG: UbiA family prenyltransferase [Pirellulaceae bacterium]
MAKASAKKHKKSSSASKSAPARPSPLLDYLRLLRIPNVFTAMADVAMGFVFVHPLTDARYPGQAVFSGLFERGVFPLLVLASSLLYLAGMVLNDVYDVEVDRQERPERPIPSGRIPLVTAMRLGYGMLLGGVVLAWLAGLLAPWQGALPWRAGVVATLLAGAVPAYDRVLKKTSVGPMAMGACRFFNVLLGMSVAGGAAQGGLAVLAFTPAQLVAAAGIGVYIAGVTLFARDEAKQSRQLQLGAALVVMVMGIVLLGLFPRLLPEAHLAKWADRARMLDVIWPLVLAVLSITIVRRCSVAVMAPSPLRVQTSVKMAILSLIVLDAAVAFLMSGPPPAATIGILALLAPTLLLGRWVYST